MMAQIHQKGQKDGCPDVVQNDEKPPITPQDPAQIIDADRLREQITMSLSRTRQQIESQTREDGQVQASSYRMVE